MVLKSGFKGVLAVIQFDGYYMKWGCWAYGSALWNLSLPLSRYVSVYGCGWEAISRQTLYSLSVLQCIERTGLTNSCKSSRVPPAVGVRCKSVTLGTEAHFSDRVAWMCEQKHWGASVCLYACPWQCPTADDSLFVYI